MMSREGHIEWLQHGKEEYHSGQNSMNDMVEELEREGMLDPGFSSIDELEEVDMGDGKCPRLMYISACLPKEHKEKICELVQEFSDCFT
jgi:hypothetical protein